jgi:hypothetical protein
LTFAAGSYTWNAAISLDNAKGVTLICATKGACAVSAAGMQLGMYGTVSGINNNLYRISGFVFDGYSGNSQPIWFYGSGTYTLSKLRIDNNSFTNATDTPAAIWLGDNSSCMSVYGVIDNNTLTSSHTIKIAEGFSSTTCTPGTNSMGTVNNLFFEDNTITVTTMTNAGEGCIDWQGAHAWVWRFNTTTNCLVTSHGVTHGWGTINSEVYNNTMIVNSGSAAQGFDDGYRLYHHQGAGEMMTFNNTFTKSASATWAVDGTISVMHYRSATPAGAGYGLAGQCNGSDSNDGNRSGEFGYPCKRQPGRDPAAKLKPIYAWNNKKSDTGAIVALTCENHPSETPPPSTCGSHVVANRDYYDAVSITPQTSTSAPFNGTTGMGFGIASRRPSTCTSNTGPDAGNGGVGYWATDEGNWNGKVGTSQGRLYRCSATNTWTLHYTPYKYPHPLRVKGGPTPPVVN